MPLAFAKALYGGNINLQHFFYLRQNFSAQWEAISPGSNVGIGGNKKFDDRGIRDFVNALPVGWVEIVTLDQARYLLNLNQVSGYWSSPDAKGGFQHRLTPIAGMVGSAAANAELVIRVHEESLSALIESAELPVGKRIRIGIEDMEQTRR